MLELFLLGFETATWHVWPGLKTLKSPAAAFESLSTAQPSACTSQVRAAKYRCSMKFNHPKGQVWSKFWLFLLPSDMFFAWAHVFFFPFHKPTYYECAFFLAKPTTHARVVRHNILKRNGKKTPWAQSNNSLPNNHPRHNEHSFNSTKWRCPYDNVTYCEFTQTRKQLPKQLPPYFTWHAPEWTCSLSLP